jgi:hypothetical protein
MVIIGVRTAACCERVSGDLFTAPGICKEHQRVSLSMRQRLKLLPIVSVLLILLGGCSSKPILPFEPEPAANPDNARVYVYWPGQSWREKAGSSLELQVDGAPVGLLRYKTYIPLEVSAGFHEFRITGDHQSADWVAEWDGDDKFFETRLRPGDVKFVRLLIKFDQASNKWTSPGMQFVVQFLPRSAKSAVIEMAELEVSPN